MKKLKKIGLYLILFHIIPFMAVVMSLIGGHSFMYGYLTWMLFNAFILLIIGLCKLIVWVLVELEII